MSDQSHLKRFKRSKVLLLITLVLVGILMFIHESSIQVQELWKELLLFSSLGFSYFSLMSYIKSEARKTAPALIKVGMITAFSFIIIYLIYFIITE